MSESHRTLVLYLSIQVAEVAIFLGVVVFAILARPLHPSLALVGGGLLAGKALTLALAALNWRLPLRSAVGYLSALLVVAVAILAIHGSTGAR